MNSNTLAQQKNVQFFRELSLKEKSVAGGKGGTLAFLYQKGYPVPDGFVILPSAFDGDKLLLEAWKQVQELVKRMLKKNQDTSFAVRSSALAEDSAHASFAGEFDTVLDVKTKENIHEAIQAVRESRHSERVKAYSIAKGIDFSHEIAVVVQRLVRSEISGVLFTADPVTGNRNRMIGNYVHGLGEKLVSGEVDASEFILYKSTKGKYEGPPDLQKHAKQFYKLGNRLEKDLGGPQDIEWGIVKDKLYILQSRPITTFQTYDTVTGERNATFSGDYLWTNVLNAEIYPDVMTTSTASIWEILLDKLSVDENRPSFGFIAGRPYVNFSMVYSFLSKIYRNPEKRRELMESTMALPPEDMEIPPFQITWKTVIFNVIPQEMKTELKKNKLKKTITDFLGRIPNHCQDLMEKASKTQEKAQLVSLLQDEIIPLFIDVFTLQDAMNEAQAMKFRDLKSELHKYLDKSEVNVLSTTINSSSDQLASIGLIVGLSKLKKEKISLEEFKKQFGHRGSQENYLTKPRPYEDDEWIDKQLADLGKSPIDVSALLEKSDAGFNKTWEQIKPKIKHKKVVSIKKKIDSIQETCISREAVRSELTRIVGVIRNWFLRAGELTGFGDDVFFLTYLEVIDVLSGDDSSIAYIPNRKKTYEKYKALPLTPSWIRGRFDPEKWASDPDRRIDVFDSWAPLPPLEASDTIKGIPGSAGRVEGIVRRINDPEEGEMIQPGEILVTSTTNIGWSPLFPRVAAVITDVGAALSHAAIVARELGIPAVVGCGNATILLKTGDRVFVDGSQGVIKILGSA
ncbi:MAG: PEP/pyruvate-binding domain-containing protein [Candidatus Hodarchaeales archaeon]|jgi:pyruvate,water dikinase